MSGMVDISSVKEEPAGDNLNNCVESLNNQSIGSEEDISLVHITALLKNSPHASVEEECLQSISEIVKSKEHVRQNLGNIVVVNIFNQKSDFSLIFNALHIPCQQCL